jgi:hypothetical protein
VGQQLGQEPIDPLVEHARRPPQHQREATELGPRQLLGFDRDLQRGEAVQEPGGAQQEAAVHAGVVRDDPEPLLDADPRDRRDLLVSQQRREQATARNAAHPPRP